MVQHDERVAVAGRLERGNERITFLDEEPVVPRVDASLIQSENWASQKSSNKILVH